MSIGESDVIWVTVTLFFIMFHMFKHFINSLMTIKVFTSFLIYHLIATPYTSSRNKKGEKERKRKEGSK